jgi:hypothetical protein
MSLRPVFREMREEPLELHASCANQRCVRGNLKFRRKRTGINRWRNRPADNNHFNVAELPTEVISHVRFNTTKADRWETDARRCHINWVILDSDWESESCRVAEAHPRVRAYVKNHNLGFEVNAPPFLIEIRNLYQTRSRIN